jgi:antitoxin MazE
VKTRIQKWGNSLALRIPKSLANDAGLAEDAPVELSVMQGRLIIDPASPEPPSLGELIRGIKRTNLHDA